MRIYRERRYQRCPKYFSGGARRTCLWRDGAARLPVEAGTHRGESGFGLNVTGIHVLQDVEDEFAQHGRDLGGESPPAS